MARRDAAGSHRDHEDRADGKVNQSVATCRPYYVCILVPRPSMRAWLEYAWREGLRTRLLEDACCVSDIQGYRACMQWTMGCTYSNTCFMPWCQAKQGAYSSSLVPI